MGGFDVDTQALEKASQVLGMSASDLDSSRGKWEDATSDGCSAFPDDETGQAYTQLWDNLSASLEKHARALESFAADLSDSAADYTDVDAGEADNLAGAGQ